MSDQPTIVLCPGQGAQHAGMGKAWAQRSDIAARTFAQADEALGMDLSGICFEGPEEQVRRTDIAQPAIYVASIACFRALQEEGELEQPDAVAGLSLGEYTALHLAGAVDFLEGLDMVARRGRFMQQAAQAAPSGMVALIGVDESSARTLCDTARNGDVLAPANFNSPGQVVISGSSDACERALDVAKNQGVRAQPLDVAGAFHSPLMDEAAQGMAHALDEVTWRRPRIPVLSNASGGPHDEDPDTIKQRLVEQITHPVRWERNLKWLLEKYPGDQARYVELAPGKVLSGLMRRTDRKAKVKNFAQVK